MVGIDHREHGTPSYATQQVGLRRGDRRGWPARTNSPSTTTYYGVDRGGIAGDATSRASGLISTPQVFPELPAFGAHAIDFFETFNGTGIVLYAPGGSCSRC